MGPFAYYSPIGLGLLLTLILNAAIRERLPADWSPGVAWTVITAIGVLVGIMCQVLMIGSQGISAQVLPAPIGKSIRGRPAVITGFCMIGAVALLATAAVMYTDSRGPAVSVAVVAGVVALIAAGVYAWSWPAAVRDFDEARN